jgi:hypothetical protein
MLVSPSFFRRYRQGHLPWITLLSGIIVTHEKGLDKYLGVHYTTVSSGALRRVERQ